MRSGVCIALAVASAGCPTADDTVTFERTYDACAPLTLVATTPTELQASGMRGAEQLWVERGAPALGRRAGTTLEVRFEEAATAFRGSYDDQDAVIYINDEIESRTVLSIVIAHELGHAFGLVHVDASDRLSVMNPGNLSTAPTPADQQALEAVWGTCL